LTSHPRDKPAASAAVRERILEAAIAILHEAGGRRLTQTAVAERAGIRQSHLTYYFPTRFDLLEVVTAEAVNAMADAVRDAIGSEADRTDAAWLRDLATSVAETAHMRMFVGMIAEADGDPVIRAAMVSATRRMEAVIAGVIGGEDAEARARVVLAALWGLGLYAFLIRPEGSEAIFTPYVSWLAGAAGAVAERPARDLPGRRRP
jgi:AcrR family transcriptional regulator